MKTTVLITRISNDQLITEDKKQTIETYMVTTDHTPNAPTLTIHPENLDSELVGWIYEKSRYDKESDTLTITFCDLSNPEDYK